MRIRSETEWQLLAAHCRALESPMNHWPLTDEQREEVISVACQLAQGSAESNLRRYWHDLMRTEIANRSPAQVAKLEQEKGLRAA